MDNLRSLKSRIARLLEHQGPADGPPECLVFLPACGRTPEGDRDLPLPRLAWRSAKAACVLFDPTLGQPAREEVRRLIDGAVAT